jgi:hypothetical protein
MEISLWTKGIHHNAFLQAGVLVVFVELRSKHLKEQLEGGRICFAHGSEGSFHGCLAPCAWAEHNGIRSLWKKRFFSLWQTRREKAGRSQGKICPSKIHLQ